jgi:hypothetical protein
MQMGEHITIRTWRHGTKHMSQLCDPVSSGVKLTNLYGWIQSLCMGTHFLSSAPAAKSDVQKQTILCSRNEARPDLHAHQEIHQRIVETSAVENVVVKQLARCHVGAGGAAFATRSVGGRACEMHDL